MDRLEIAVSLLTGCVDCREHQHEILTKAAFQMADKILAHHEQTKPKQEPDKNKGSVSGSVSIKLSDNETAYVGMNALGSAWAVTATEAELKLRQRYADSEQALKNIDKMKAALTAEEFENWVGNEPLIIDDYEKSSAIILFGSFSWSKSNQNDAYWRAAYKRLLEQEK